jgi:hypothetical protein
LERLACARVVFCERITGGNFIEDDNENRGLAQTIVENYLGRLFVFNILKYY